MRAKTDNKVADSGIVAKYAVTDFNTKNVFRNRMRYSGMNMHGVNKHLSNSGISMARVT